MRGRNGYKLGPLSGRGTAQVFTVSSVLGSAEGERCQAGHVPHPVVFSRLISENFENSADKPVAIENVVHLLAGR
jgi:hypothetical protein